MNSPPKKNEIDYKCSSGLFTAFALLNATGYHNECGWHFSRSRQAVRMELAYCGDSWRSRMADEGMLELFHKGNGAVLMDIIPFSGSPPDFKVPSDMPEYLTTWQAESWKNSAMINAWLSKFYHEENISILWNKWFKECEQQIQMLKTQESLLRETITLFNGISADQKPRIILCPNILDTIGRGYSMSTKETTWIFTGPIIEEKKIWQVLGHELIHRWVDPVAEKLSFGQNPESIKMLSAQYRMVAQCYPELYIWVAESVVRALSICLMLYKGLYTEQQCETQTEQEESLGFIGVSALVKEIKGQFPPVNRDLLMKAISIALKQSGQILIDKKISI